MKKALLLITCLFSFLTIRAKAEKVPVYMISKNGCSACQYASEFFKDLDKKNPELFELIDIEVFDSSFKFKSDELKALYEKVYEYFGEDSNQAATPSIVIGDYFTKGLPKDTNIIYEKIINVRDNATEDVFKSIANELNININKVKKAEDASGKYDYLIVGLIFVLVIGGFASLLIASKKK